MLDLKNQGWEIMTKTLNNLKLQLTEAIPDLNITKLEIAGSGFTCQGYIVNEEILCKIPHKADFASMIETEAYALEALKGQVDNIPALIYMGILPTGLPVICESLIPGKIIGEKAFASLSVPEQENLMLQIGSTVKQIQSAEVKSPHFPVASLHSRLQFVRDNFTDIIKNELSEREENLMEELFSAYECLYLDKAFQSVFSQGDIYLENIMYDKETKTMTGLVDFGLAGYTDPYDDLHHFYQFDYKFLGNASGLKIDREGQLKVLFYAMSDLLGFINVLSAQNQDYNIYKPYLHNYLNDFKKWQNYPIEINQRFIHNNLQIFF